MPQPWTHTACLPVICKHSLQWVSCIFCVGRANTWLNKCCFEPLRVVIKAASFAAKSQPLFEFFGLKLLPGCWAQAAGRKIEPLQLLPLASPAALTSRVTCFHHPAAQRVFRQAAVVPSSCLLKTTSFLSCPGATHFSQPDRHLIFSRPPHKSEKCVSSPTARSLFPCAPVRRATTKSPSAFSPADLCLPRPVLTLLRTNRHIHIHTHIMAQQQQQQQVPTFKLVLVGDGGTGKVSLLSLFFFAVARPVPSTAG